MTELDQLPQDREVAIPRLRAYYERLGFQPYNEAGVMVAFVLVYAFFAYFTWESGFVSWAGTASWLNVSAQLGIIELPEG